MRKRTRKAKLADVEGVRIRPLSIRLPVDLLDDMNGWARADHHIKLAPFVRVVLQEYAADRRKRERKTA